MIPHLPHLSKITRITTGFGIDGHAEIIVVYTERAKDGREVDMSHIIPIPVTSVTGNDIVAAMDRLRTV